MRVRDGQGHDAVLVIQVHPDDGDVHASLGKTAIRLSPEEVSRLRELYYRAMTVALQDRGTW